MIAPSGTMTPAVRLRGSRGARAAAVELLRACVRDGGLPAERAETLLASMTPDVILPLAAYHRVGGLLYETLLPLVGPDQPVVAALRQGYADVVRGHMRVLWELERLRGLFDETGSRWAVVKGPVLVELLYGGPGLRPYADLDLLVEPAGFRDVLNALERTGSWLLDRNWAVLRKELRGQVHLVLPGGTPLDLHWNLINMYRRRMRIDTDELLARASRVELGGVVVPTLDETDTLLHLAAHAGLAGGDRLIWLKDLERAIGVRPPAWDAVVDRARAWQVAGVVGFMLARAADVLGAHVPTDVRRQLVSPRMEQLIRLVDQLSPWEQSVGRLSAANLILSRSIGHGLAGGLAWIAERSIRNLDPREPRASSTLTPSGTAHDREAFLDAVAQVGERRGDAKAPPSSR